MKQSTSHGFTLIELIIVIVILGILALTAAPRFLNLADDANEAVMRTLAANLQKAVKDTHLRWLMLGSPGRVQNMQGFSDNTIDMSSNGWPIGLNKGNANDNVGRGNAGCTSLWNYLLIDGPRSATNTAQDFQSYRHSGNTSCSYIYRGNGDTANRTSAKLGVIYNSQTGTVRACGTLTDTNC